MITRIAPQPAERDRTRVRGLARQGEAGFGFAIDGNGRRDPAAPGSTTCDVQQREDSGDRAGWEAGGTFTHDGVTLYYEVYGAGDPLLIVHFNGGSIADVGAQVDHFRKGYKVIAMDSRDHGKSGDSPDKLTYEKMTDDLAALLDHLKTGPVDVLGWSDGGIEALLLGIRRRSRRSWRWRPTSNNCDRGR